jgi:putative transposase
LLDGVYNHKKKCGIKVRDFWISGINNKQTPTLRVLRPLGLGLKFTDMGNIREPFLPNHTYHVYNHAIGKSNLFFEPDNYEYFLDLYKKHIFPFTRLFAFCLMPNHFHFVLKIGNAELIEEFIKSNEYKLTAKKFDNPNNLICHLFGNLFNAYAKGINKRYNRKGSLFVASVRRKMVLEEDYLRQLIIYVNLNPLHHEVAQEIEEWPHSSIRHILHKNSFVVDYPISLSFFNSAEEFIKLHQDYLDKIKKAGGTGLFKSDFI